MDNEEQQEDQEELQEDRAEMQEDQEELQEDSNETESNPSKSMADIFNLLQDGMQVLASINTSLMVSDKPKLDEASVVDEESPDKNEEEPFELF